MEAEHTAQREEEEEAQEVQAVFATERISSHGGEVDVDAAKQPNPQEFSSGGESKDKERDCIRVCVRVRPFMENEDPTKCIDVADNTMLVLKTGSGCSKEFRFDRVFGPDSTQEDVYSEVSSFPSLMFEGYSCCIFAYGQTGSGKTYTMQGASDGEGVSTRTLKELFQILKRKSDESEGRMVYEVEGSMFEIYNEQVIDLLDGARMSDESQESGAEGEAKKNPEETDIEKKNRKIGGSPTSDDDSLERPSYLSRNTCKLLKCRKYSLSSYTQLQALLDRGYYARSTCSTLLNESSSRSHCVIRVQLACRCIADATCFKTQLFLVDLAGSERPSQSGTIGKSLMETKNINKSLTILSRVMQALYAKQSYIPFRESLLTRLLKDALLGLSKTCMFVTISPCVFSRGQTLNSLALGSSVKRLEIAPIKKLSLELDRKQLLLHAKKKLKKFCSTKLSIQEAFTHKLQQIDQDIQHLKTLILGLETGQPIDPNDATLSLCSPDASVKATRQASYQHISSVQQHVLPPAVHRTPSRLRLLDYASSHCALRPGLADAHHPILARPRHDVCQDHDECPPASKENFQPNYIPPPAHDDSRFVFNKPPISLLHSPSDRPSRPPPDPQKQKKTVSFLTPSSTIIHYQPPRAGALLRATPLKPKPSPCFKRPPRASRVPNAFPQHPPSASLPCPLAGFDLPRQYASHTLSTSQNLDHSRRRARRVLVKDPGSKTALRLKL